VYCSQTVGWIKMKLGMQVCHRPRRHLLDGVLAPPQLFGCILSRTYQLAG